MTLSPEDFHKRVLAAEPGVAVFDCDGTLWSGDAGSGFMRWSVETGLLSPERIEWLDSRYQGYLKGSVSELAICGEMVQVYAGLREDELRQAAATFFAQHIEDNIFPELVALLQELQQRGTDIWAVSSTCDWVIEEGVQRFGIAANRVLAAKVAIEHGSLRTGSSMYPPTKER